MCNKYKTRKVQKIKKKKKHEEVDRLINQKRNIDSNHSQKGNKHGHDMKSKEILEAETKAFEIIGNTELTSLLSAS